MEIIVTDRESIEAGIIIHSAYVVISIHDPHKQRAKVRKQGGLRGVLYLAFHDAEPTAAMEIPDDIKMMTPEQASQIWTFVDQHMAKVGVIVVHCEQGMSRSPAVAAAISKSLGLDESRFWSEYQPNRHVYRSVLHAYAVRREGGSA
ncbi:MAG: hypothetical protein WCI73_01370 [Phycisphaerae bacterium]